MTLEAYLRHEIAEGKTDFWFRAGVVDGQVEIYIHPDGRPGLTTPMLIVQDNHVSEKVWPVNTVLTYPTNVPDALRGGE